MVNEIIFFLILVVNLLFIYIAKRVGKDVLFSVFILNIFLATMFAPSVINFFGTFVSLSVLFYAPLFVIVEIVNENYGRKESFKLFHIGFATIFCFFVLSSLGIYFINHSEETADIAISLNTIFSTSVQVFVGSLVAYYLGQNVNIHVYEFLKKRSPLWLRHNVTNFLAQGVDSVIFYPIAFIGLLSVETLIIVTLTGWIFKSLIASAMTPLAYWVRNKE